MNKQELAFRCYAIADTFRTKITLPPSRYLVQAFGQAGWKLQLDKARQYKIGKGVDYDASNSKIQYGMYNATYDTGNTINLQEDIIGPVLRNGFKTATSHFKILKMTARHGRFEVYSEYTSEYGYKSLSDNKNITNVEFLVKITRNGKTQGAIFVFFNSGRLRFSGGYTDGDPSEPAKLLKFMLNESVDTSKIKVNNTTGEFKVGYKLDLDTLYHLLDVPEASAAKYKGYTLRVSKKETGSTVYIKFNSKHTFTLVCSANGTVQIEGADDIKETFKITTEFIKLLAEMQIVQSATGKQATTPRATKVAQVLTMKPAPNVTRRGTSCPTDRCPVPYSFEGHCQYADYYIKPNPQGQPCCYKKPQSTKYSREKIEAAFRKANVRIPSATRKLFELNEVANKQVNVGKNIANLRTYYNSTIGKNGKEVGFKIDTRQCVRYTKVALVDIARRMGIVGVSASMTKPDLCNLIQTQSKKLGLNKTSEVSGKLKVAVGRQALTRNTGDKIKIGKRVCETYDKGTIARYASSLGITIDGTKKDLCAAIGSYMNTRRNNLVAALTPPRPPPPKAKTEDERLRNSIEAVHGNVTNDNLRALKAKIKEYKRATKRTSTKGQVTNANINRFIRQLR